MEPQLINEQRQEDGVHLVIMKNVQALSDVYDRIIQWDTKHHLIVSPSIEIKDLDQKRNLIVVRNIVQAGIAAQFLLSRIQTLGVTALLTSNLQQLSFKPKESDEEKKKELDDKKATMTNLPLQERLLREFWAMKELYLSLKEVDMVHHSTIRDFCTSNTVDRKKHHVALQSLAKKAGQLVFFLSTAQGIISQKLWIYQKFLTKGYLNPVSQPISVVFAVPCDPPKKRHKRMN